MAITTKTVTMKEALAQLQDRYASLTANMTRLRTAAQKSGRTVPVEAMKAHNAAVADHLRVGNQIFDELNKRKLTVEQVVLKDGKVIADAMNNLGVKTIRVAAPLRPPVFASDAVGIVPVMPIIYTVGALLVVGVGGYFTVQALEQIKFILRGPDQDLDKKAKHYAEVFDKLVKSGLSPKEAADRAAALTAPPPTSLGTNMFLIGLPIVAIGVLYLWSKGRGGGEAAAPAAAPA